MLLLLIIVIHFSTQIYFNAEKPHAKVLTVDLLQLKNNTVISFAVYVHGQATKLNQSPTIDL